MTRSGHAATQTFSPRITRINANIKPKEQRFDKRRDSGGWTKPLFFDSRQLAWFAGRSSKFARSSAHQARVKFQHGRPKNAPGRP